jgi:hypothetical protein
LLIVVVSVGLFQWEGVGEGVVGENGRQVGGDCPP